MNLYGGHFFVACRKKEEFAEELKRQEQLMHQRQEALEKLAHQRRQAQMKRADLELG